MRIPKRSLDVNGLYGKLHVGVDATRAEIVKAARELLFRTHPDMGGDVHEFEDVLYAYRTLANEKRRAAYDSLEESTKSTIKVGVASFGVAPDERIQPAWYKDSCEILSKEDEERVVRWLWMLVSVAADFRYWGPIKAGISNNYKHMFWLDNDIFMIGKYEPQLWMAEVLILFRKLDIYERL